MSPRVEAQVKPELLRWARKSAGLEVKAAAKKVPVQPGRLEAWERGDARPTVKQLRKLAQAYRRPFALFYLPEPPRDFQPMHDFRRLPGQVAGVQSPELRYELRRALNRRELALDLFQSVRGTPKEFILRADISEDPEALATRLREALGVELAHQFRWRPGYESFNKWREAVERLDVLVFQLTDVEPSESRGFSVSQRVLPLIALNVKDPPAARTFTVLHELTHLVLRRGGLCDLDDHTTRAPEELRTEVFANIVAGATLMPHDALLAESTVRSQRGPEAWDDQQIKSLAEKYGTSREAMLRRLLILGRTTERFYRRKRAQFQREYEERQGQREAGFAPPHRMAISSAGPVFVQIVLTNYHQENITASDVADFLEVRLKHLDKIEAEVFGRSGFAA